MASLAAIKALEAKIAAAAASSTSGALGGLLKSNADAESSSLLTSMTPNKYDPAIPNDYEEFCRERDRKARHEAAERRAQRQEEEKEQRKKEREERDKFLEQERQDRDKRQRLESSAVDPAHLGQRAAPNPGARTGLDAEDQTPFAQRMMKGWGWQAGEGLGKEGQGVTAALAHEKTGKRTANIVQQEAPKVAPPPVPAKKAIRVKGRPTRVLLLLNMVGPGEVDSGLQAEIEEECTKYGPVEKVAIHECKVRPYT